MHKFIGSIVVAFSLLGFMTRASYSAYVLGYPPGKCNEETGDRQAAADATRALVVEVIAASFPELTKYRLTINSFNGDTTYFKTRFSISDYLTFRGLKIVMSVNPCVYALGAPPDGLRAIIAHELAHADYYRRKNVFGLIGLIRLADGGSVAKFERKTDLVAIERGYGEGLIKYRRWLYENVPEGNLASKKRDYFTPEEIALLIPMVENKPAVVQRLSKRVPRNIHEVEKAIAQ